MVLKAAWERSGFIRPRAYHRAKALSDARYYYELVDVLDDHLQPDISRTLVKESKGMPWEQIERRLEQEALVALDNELPNVLRVTRPSYKAGQSELAAKLA